MKYAFKVGGWWGSKVFRGHAKLIREIPHGGAVIRLRKAAGPYRAGSEIRISADEIVK